MNHAELRRPWSRIVSCYLRLLPAVALMVTATNATCHGNELSTIIESYRKQQASLTSFSVKYHSSASALGTPQELRRFCGIPYLSETDNLFAYKGKMRYYMSSNKGAYEDLTERNSDGSPVLIKVAPGGLRVSNGSEAYLLDAKPWRPQPPGLITPSEKVNDSDGTYFNQTYLNESLRGLPDVFGADKRRHMFSLIELSERSMLKMRGAHEEIDGAKCAVLEWLDVRDDDEQMKFRHAVWCDPALNYAVRQHDMYYDGGSTRVRHIVCSDFAEIVPGCWYPKRIIADEYADARKATKEVLGKPLLRYQHVVEEMRANDISDAIFTPEVPPGTVVSDARFLKNGQPIVYTQPADRQQLDGLIKSLVDGQKAAPPPAKAKKYGTVIFLNVAAISVVIVGLWLRRRR